MCELFAGKSHMRAVKYTAGVFYLQLPAGRFVLDQQQLRHLHLGSALDL